MEAPEAPSRQMFNMANQTCFSRLKYWFVQRFIGNQCWKWSIVQSTDVFYPFTFM